MKILILNWRSLKDKYEGGAERATYEFAKEWIKKHDAEVFWISPPYDINIKEEEIDGIKFIYVGMPLTRNPFELFYLFPLFYFNVIKTYLKRFKGKVDIVMDQVHGIPYMTPFYVKEKIVVYIHEVAGSIWDIMYPFPINTIGKILERIMFIPYMVKNIPFIANSPSTYKDLVSKVGIRKEQITVVNYGLTAPLNDVAGQKEKELTIIYLNRIVKMKGIVRGINAFANIVKVNKNAKLWIVGTGEKDFTDELFVLVKQLHLTDNVDFLGFKDGAEKFDLLSRAHVLINPSYLEGWGLVNLEANRMGTPTVAFKVKGCIDSVIDGVSGYLCEDDNTDEMAEKVIQASENLALRKSALEYSKTYTWQIQSEKFYDQLKR